MKLFECQNCGQIVYFENVACERCGAPLGYLTERATMSALGSAGSDEDGPYSALAEEGGIYRYCDNRRHGACNWLVEAQEGASRFCRACALNGVIPDLSVPAHRERWLAIEAAKHRLVYSLLRLDLPVRPKAHDGDDTGILFRFMADAPDEAPDGNGGAGRIITGHMHGTITLNIEEADPVAREAARRSMGEPYRTLLGHFRHEIGHYYWEVLVDSDPDRLAGFRTLFGDERKDYGAALERHYAAGPPADWQSRHVSAYAAAHPWEDWAESWAHYLHIVDTLETAYAFELSAGPRHAPASSYRAHAAFDPYRDASFERIAATWLPLTALINSLNRSMGHPDAYPFVLSPAVLEKLAFVHRTIHGLAGSG